MILKDVIHNFKLMNGVIHFDKAKSGYPGGDSLGYVSPYRRRDIHTG